MAIVRVIPKDIANESITPSLYIIIYLYLRNFCKFFHRHLAQASLHSQAYSHHLDSSLAHRSPFKKQHEPWGKGPCNGSRWRGLWYIWFVECCIFIGVGGALGTLFSAPLWLWTVLALLALPSWYVLLFCCLHWGLILVHHVIPVFCSSGLCVIHVHGGGDIPCSLTWVSSTVGKKTCGTRAIVVIISRLYYLKP